MFFLCFKRQIADVCIDICEISLLVGLPWCMAPTLMMDIINYSYSESSFSSPISLSLTMTLVEGHKVSVKECLLDPLLLYI